METHPRAVTLFNSRGHGVTHPEPSLADTSQPCAASKTEVSVWVLWDMRVRAHEVDLRMGPHIRFLCSSCL